MKKPDELAMQIQQGRKDLLPDLWEEVCRFTDMFAKKYYAIISAGRPAPGGVTVDDLKQCAFLAVVDAISTYDPKRAGFITHLVWFLRKHFRAAIGRSERQLRDPLNGSLSLDIPARDDDPDGEKWLDGIPDPCDCIADTEDSIYREQLRKALEAALQVIPTAEAECLRAEYFEGHTQAEIAARMGVSQSRANQLRNGGLRHIRTSSAGAKLERWLDSESPFYKQVGVDRFNRTHTSAVEAVMLWREKRRAELGKGLCSP